MKNFKFIVNRNGGCGAHAGKEANTPPCCSKRASRFVWVLVLMLTIGIGQMWGADTQLYFEGWESNHRTSGNNNYTSSNSYGSWTLSNADAANSGSPLTDSYHAILRVAKNTTNSPSVVSGALLNDPKYEIHKVSWNHKGVNAMTLTVSYSHDGSSWTVGKTVSGMQTSKTADSFSISNFTGPIYLKFVVSVSSSTGSHRDANIDDITIEGVELADCEKIGAPSVTATTDNQTTNLSWTNQTGASSYTVTRTPADGTVGTPSKSENTWSCAITDLTNGTAYTWTVTPVGNGTTHCADGNTAASASATPNVSRTITYYDKDGQHTTSLADGTNIANALYALYGANGPTSCDTEDYEYFVGWKEGSINGTASSVTLLSTEVVNATNAAKTYYAVWSNQDPSSGSWEQTTSVATGDQVVIAQIDDGTNEMTGFNTTITTDNNYGTYDAFDTDPAGTWIWTVEAGSSNGTFSFKHGDYYMNLASNNNYLNGSSTKNDNSSWTVSTSNSRAVVTNVAQTSRKIMWNKSSPRFASYAKNHGNNSGSYYYYIVFYKQTSSGTPEYITTCCNKLGSINGSFFWTTHFCPAWPAKHRS